MNFEVVFVVVVVVDVELAVVVVVDVKVAVWLLKWKLTIGRSPNAPYEKGDL